VRTKLSIVIPVYNRVDEIATCLSSVTLQKLDAELQIIVVDDASSEGGIKREAENYNACYLRVEKRSGAGYCKNYGFLHSDGEYVLFLDSDIDFINPKTIQSSLNILIRDSRCGQAGGEGLCSPSGEVSYIFGRNIDMSTGKSRCDYVDVNLENSQESLWEFDYIPTSNCLLRRETINMVGGFDDAYNCLGEDKEFGYRVKKLGFRNYVNKYSVVRHRFSTNSRSRLGLRKQHRTQIRFLIRAFGIGRALKILFQQTKSLLLGLFHPVSTERIIDPLILAFEEHYIVEILGLKYSNKTYLEKNIEVVGVVLSLLSAFIWNLFHLNGINKKGSTRLQNEFFV